MIVLYFVMCALVSGAQRGDGARELKDAQGRAAAELGGVCRDQRERADGAQQRGDLSRGDPDVALQGDVRISLGLLAMQRTAAAVYLGLLLLPLLLQNPTTQKCPSQLICPPIILQPSPVLQLLQLLQLVATTRPLCVTARTVQFYTTQ